MSKQESDVVLNFKMNGEINYSRTIKDINKEMNLAATEYKNQVSAMDKNATQTEKLTATKKKLEKQLSLAEQRTKLLREEYEKSVKETGEYSEQSQKLYKRLLESETGENKLRSALQSTNEALKEQGNLSIKTAEKLAKIEKAGDKIKSVGQKLSVGLTAPIMGIGAASIAAFKELDECLDNITTATGATGSQLESLQASFKTVAGQIPADMQDISTGIGEVNTQFGLMDKQLEDTTGRMLKFSEINGSDVSQSTINAKKSMDLFRLSIEDLPMILDSVSKISQDTGVGVDQLFDAVNRGAPQLKAMGLGFSESTMLIGQMEKAGIDSAGTLGYLAKASVVYAKDNKTMQEGLSGTIESIKGATTEQEKLTIASEVFGTKAASKMVEAIDSGALSMDGLADSAKNAAGTVDQTFSDILDPIDQAKLAQNQFKIAMGELGEQVQIALLPAFQAATDAIKKVSEWFGSLTDSQKQTILKIAGVVAAIGPVLVVLGTLASSISSLIPVIAFIASPIGLVIAAVAAWVAAIVVAYNKIGWFRDFINTSFNVIKDIVVGVFKVLADTTKSTFDFITGFIGGAMDGAVKIISDYVNAITRIFGGIIDFVTGVFTGDWSRAWQGVVDIFGGIFEGIAAVAKAPINAMITLINGFLGGLNNIKIPKWVPGVGGKGFSIAKIPYLAEGGHMINGQAIVGEAGPELLTAKNGKTTVTPLSQDEKARGIGGALKGNSTVNNYVTIGQVDANNPSEINRLNRKMFQANVWNNLATGDV
ncbi:phage tail tape measure protein [Enterococcus sp. GC33]|uniref:phage tail tape measure protein n=1 Tax=Enterococcus TaxID=1350 RepID=UPI000CF1D786|nr:phage tail tape measure protein [Enterococcus faecalis]EGO5985637.1 phage tail tape measure protein [Enterococcus faecalis]EGO6537027.1 phage tail tape measure protein [Enterococcus faecalis]EHK9655124.1 phage tail tape measure protein [Enterococcus faecalis]PQF65058.1 phage tail tape measure protein [Enterococcus faecalis]RBR56677.1 phage tail tape measure protein, TP901 family, core region [Enterococcus faecalis]